MEEHIEVEGRILTPGTDKLPNLVDLLPQISGTVIVTIPSAISQFVVGKSIQMATTFLNTPVIGIIENMSGPFCRHCGEKIDLFPEGMVEEQAKNHGIPFLGSIPFDPHLAACADKGKSFMNDFSDTEAGKSLYNLSAKILEYFN